MPERKSSVTPRRLMYSQVGLILLFLFFATGYLWQLPETARLSALGAALAFVVVLLLIRFRKSRILKPLLLSGGVFFMVIFLLVAISPGALVPSISSAFSAVREELDDMAHRSEGYSSQPTDESSNTGPR